VFAPWLAPNPPDRRYPDLLYAPPTRVHLFDDHGSGPHAHAWRLVSRIERRFEEDASMLGPMLPLGADAYGRDIYSRLMYGARISLSLAVCATLAASLLGALIGGIAGYAGGWIDGILSRCSEFVLVLPAVYVALALRAVMPLVLPSVDGLRAAARDLRAAWLANRRRVVCARSSRRSASASTRSPRARQAPADRACCLQHLLPAAGGYLRTQATLLLPAFIPRGSDALVHRPRLSRQPRRRGDDAAGGRRMCRCLPNAPWMLAPGRCDIFRGARRQPRGAEHGPRACTIRGTRRSVFARCAARSREAAPTTTP
jgi:peptide/nickel transport system permease protein